MKKLHDVTKLKAWPQLKELGFKPIKYTFQGLAYSIGAFTTLPEPGTSRTVGIELKYWNGAHKESSGLDIRFRDHTWSKSCRYALRGKKLTKELELLIWKIKHSNKFTTNLHKINY